MVVIKLNKDGTVDLNEMAVRLAKKEAGAKETDIGQIKELMKVIAQDLMEIRNKKGLAGMM